MPLIPAQTSTYVITIEFEGSGTVQQQLPGFYSKMDPRDLLTELRFKKITKITTEKAEVPKDKGE